MQQILGGRYISLYSFQIDYTCLFSYLILQRTFVGVDTFSIFQEIQLQTDDPRVSNIVKFSETIGELKVEVYMYFLHLSRSDSV